MEDRQISFKSFLSHRYKSADVNLYFFSVFSEVAEVQFEIDEGTFSMNVTRLERLIRDADSFIGIYPFPGTAEEARNPEALKKQSRYFRLEIDLAVRSQKPAIIFYDKRYGNILKPPPGILSHAFDFNEVTGTGGYPSFNTHKVAFERFCDLVERRKQYDEVNVTADKLTVALFNPLVAGNTALFDSDCIQCIGTVLEQHNYSELEIINWPVSINNKFTGLLEKIDLAIVEHSGQLAAGGIPSYLHGRFIPMIRLKNTSLHKEADQLLQDFLFGGLEVGYRKDIIEWTDTASLQKELAQKLDIINASVRRINTYEEAKKYFMSATLRKEAVFVSYSGRDVDTARQIVSVLKKYFQTVFDYRDGESIEPGQPWLMEIFDKLSSSAIGISLLSDAYLKSGNCMHEVQQMVANEDEGKIKLYKVKLQSDPLDLPAFLGKNQYLRLSDYESVEVMVQAINRLSLK